MFRRYREAAAAAALETVRQPAAAGSISPEPPGPKAPGAGREAAADPARFLHGRNRYGVYAVPAEVAQRGRARQTLHGGVWDRETLDLLRRLAGQGDIVHAGASFGPFLPPLTAALAPGCLLWAFEPDPALFAAAEQTARLNRLDDIELHDLGLSDFEALEYLPGRAAAAPDGEMPVSVTRLDAVIAPKRPVAAIHLGFGAGLVEALRGARRLIASRRPVLLMERPVPPRWIAANICGGYREAGRAGRSLIYRFG